MLCCALLCCAAVCVCVVIAYLFFFHAQKISLIILYLVGLHQQTFFHLGYLLFFLLFFSAPHLARRMWSGLIAYCAVVLALLYWWTVQMRVQNPSYSATWSDDLVRARTHSASPPIVHLPRSSVHFQLSDAIRFSLRRTAIVFLLFLVSLVCVGVPVCRVCLW
jgi:hypothetical protein